jgi:hypothetical protein
MPALASGSSSAPAGFTAAVEENTAEDESSLDSFRWYGDEDGVDFKANRPVTNYVPPHNLCHSLNPLGPSCSQVSLESAAPVASHTGSFIRCLPSDMSATPDTIILPPGLVSMLLKAISPEALGAALCMVVADSGAIDHMLPDCAAFISYKPVHNLCVCMGNNSYPPVLQRGTAIISPNGQHLLIWNVRHVPALQVPLYSLRAHIRNCGCGFLGSFKTGMHIYFPGVVLSMDTSTNCHLSYAPLGKSALLSSLQYVQPRCPPTIYLPFELARALLRLRATLHPAVQY